MWIRHCTWLVLPYYYYFFFVKSMICFLTYLIGIFGCRCRNQNVFHVCSEKKCKTLWLLHCNGSKNCSSCLFFWRMWLEFSVAVAGIRMFCMLIIYVGSEKHAKHFIWFLQEKTVKITRTSKNALEFYSEIEKEGTRHVDVHVLSSNSWRQLKAWEADECMSGTQKQLCLYVLSASVHYKMLFIHINQTDQIYISVPLHMQLFCN